MLTDVQAGRVDVVTAWHADRLHRSPVELERYISICDPLGVPTHTVRAGELDLATASGRMTARITGAVARHESEQKGERVRRQKQQAQADGKWLGGRRPFGFGPDGYTLHPAEADAIRDATRRALAGESLRTLFGEWNAAGLTTSTGERWNGSKIRQLLLRPRNAGLIGRTRDGQGKNLPTVIGDAKWPAIVDRDSWEALRAKLTDPARLTHQGNVSRKLVGSFLYRCECGQRLASAGGRAKDGAGRYQCPEMHLARTAGPIDKLVFEVVEKVLRESGIKLMPARVGDVTALRARSEALRTRAEEIATVFADPDAGMTAAQFRVANDRIQTQLHEVQTEIGLLTGADALAGVADAVDPVAAFRAVGIERQRAVIDALMTVTILRTKPGRRPDGSYFDPASVKFSRK
jgi:DNA invertase Pin-like site-specific DNA recombinase